MNKITVLSVYLEIPTMNLLQIVLSNISKIFPWVQSFTDHIQTLDIGLACGYQFSLKL